MNLEANAVLQQAKQNLLNPPMPDFSTMSAIKAAQWCLDNGITDTKQIATTTGKKYDSIYGAVWKINNPQRTKMLQRRAKKVRDLKLQLLGKKKKAKSGKTKSLKIQLISDETKKAKPTTTQKPKIENGRYDDGMETPFLDALNRATQRFNFLDEEKQPMHELLAENRRLKILVDHYEALLFKGGK